MWWPQLPTILLWEIDLPPDQSSTSHETQVCCHASLAVNPVSGFARLPQPRQPLSSRIRRARTLSGGRSPAPRRAHPHASGRRDAEMARPFPALPNRPRHRSTADVRPVRPAGVREGRPGTVPAARPRAAGAGRDSSTRARAPDPVSAAGRAALAVDGHRGGRRAGVCADPPPRAHPPVAGGGAAASRCRPPTVLRHMGRAAPPHLVSASGPWRRRGSRPGDRRAPRG